ncbi:MAG: hypothetical protein LC130_16420 [Bryobacterales bacterium]|nr:hypothetical protein [Bryobacterales bacterium]
MDDVTWVQYIADGTARMAELDSLIQAESRQPRRRRKNQAPYGSLKRERLEKAAAAMRERYLNSGSGCKSRLKAIQKRQERMNGN